jgi:hypothetical protein
VLAQEGRVRIEQPAGRCRPTVAGQVGLRSDHQERRGGQLRLHRHTDLLKNGNLGFVCYVARA